MYKQASKEKVRFETVRGVLSTEQLWDCPITMLDRIALTLQEQWKESGKKSFLEVKSKKDKTIKLKFDIVLDILNSKVEESNAERDVEQVKQHNAKIDAIIAVKQEDALSDKSIEELEKMRK